MRRPERLRRRRAAARGRHTSVLPAGAGECGLDRIVRTYRGYGSDHQVGGYSDAFQAALEVSAAYRTYPVAAGTHGYEDPAFLDEARQWVTLFQLDEDDNARMIWGDGGLAMWAIRRTDLAARDFTAAYFTIDSH
ncbi:DUF1963 domain-containing protein [Actinoplanes ianthinogenes]|uniref:DUF1963 domain-containing protein n=1 Tax=Actinoplanes ianthinogenes TaxID=122358 RepID=UPI003CC811FF